MRKNMKSSSTAAVKTSLEQKEDSVVTFQLPHPTVIQVASSLTGDFEKRKVEKIDDKYVVDLGVNGEKRSVQWVVETRMTKQDLAELKKVIRDKEVDDIKVVSTAELAEIVENMQKTRDKIGYRYQGSKFGLAAVALEPIEKGSYIPMSSDFLPYVPGSTDNDYSFLIELNDSFILKDGNISATRLDVGFLLQYAPEQKEISQLFKAAPSAQVRLTDLATENCVIETELYYVEDKDVVFRAMRTQCRLEAKQLLTIDYGAEYFYKRNLLPMPFSAKTGEIVEDIEIARFVSVSSRKKRHDFFVFFSEYSKLEPQLIRWEAEKKGIVYLTSNMLQAAQRDAKKDDSRISIDSQKQLFYQDDNEFADAILDSVEAVTKNDIEFVGADMTVRVHLADNDYGQLVALSDQLETEYGFHPDSVTISQPSASNSQGYLSIRAVDVYERLVLGLSLSHEKALVEEKTSDATGRHLFSKDR